MKLEDRSQIQVPKRYQIALEVAGFWDVCKLVWNLPQFSDHAKGKGEPILVLPGYGTGDQITFPLRQYLSYLGYQVEGWDLGLNHGNVPVLMEAFRKRLLEFSKKQNQKVTLIGWSLGGYLARETARDNPELVEQVITIASPLFGGAKYTSIADYYAEKQGIQLDELEQQIEARYDIPLQVPSLSIYSKLDNIVSWQTCIDTRTPLITHKEVQATHLGMILNPDVYKTISEYLYDHFHRLDPKD